MQNGGRIQGQANMAMQSGLLGARRKSKLSHAYPGDNGGVIIRNKARLSPDITQTGDDLDPSVGTVINPTLFMSASHVSKPLGANKTTIQATGQVTKNLSQEQFTDSSAAHLSAKPGLMKKSGLYVADGNPAMRNMSVQPSLTITKP